MPDHLNIGRDGEDIAAAYLQKNGYTILAKNWRHRHLEIDVVAIDESILVFVEVKTRSSAAFGMPYESVSTAKQEKLSRAAMHYIEENGYEGEIRFDVVSILMGTKKPNLRLIKDAFWPE